MTSPATPPLASLDLLRQLTDRHVISQLLEVETLTRSEIATRTGISKPTISESMRRLEQAGLVVETGQQQGRRGRAGVFYSLRSDLGCAVALSADQDGLVAEIRDLRGRLHRRIEHDVPAPITAAELNPRLLALTADALGDVPGPVLASALSVAGPVDKQTGRLVHLPDSPFLIDELDAVGLLADQLGPLQVGNDVNWEALAEARSGQASDLDDFFYCHLGHGLGGAIVRDQQVVVGHSGLAGEIAHVRTTGPGGRALRLIECFEHWQLTQPGAPTIDVPRVRAVLAGRSGADRALADAILDAVAGMIASVIALLNPAGVVIGGPWGLAADVQPRLAERLADSAAIPTPLRSARFGSEGPITGAGLDAVRRAQESLTGPKSAAV